MRCDMSLVKYCILCDGIGVICNVRYILIIYFLVSLLTEILLTEHYLHSLLLLFFTNYHHFHRFTPTEYTSDDNLQAVYSL